MLKPSLLPQKAISGSTPTAISGHLHDRERGRGQLTLEESLISRSIPPVTVVEKPMALAPPPPPPAPTSPEPCSHPPVPVGFCCVPCSEGYNGGPCYYGYGRPAPPPPCYDSYGFRYGHGKGYTDSRCNYFNEDNTGGCTIM
nr:formin-like protein 16 [Coffea arabica]